MQQSSCEPVPLSGLLSAYRWYRRRNALTEVFKRLALGNSEENLFDNLQLKLVVVDM
jgi:hypothetical protein